MAKREEKELLVGLDIGTSKIVAIVAEVGADNTVDVIGIGVAPSKGLKRGVVINIDATAQNIRQAVDAAELLAGVQISKVYAGIAGSHIKSLNSDGVVSIKDREVSADDISRVIDVAQSVPIASDQRVIHVIPQEFIIDNQEGIKEPVGMCGCRLEAKVHLVTGATGAVQNISKAVQNCGLELEDVVLEQIASSASVLSDDERELGVCLIDIGGGTTDIAVFTNGSLRHTAVIPIAGDQITSDIAVALRTPTKHAEDIKMRYACALRSLVEDDQEIEVPGVGDRPAQRLSRSSLVDVIEPRVEELLSMVRQELQRSGFEGQLGAGIVITGGTAKMEGLETLAVEIFHEPVRIGVPTQVTGLVNEARDPIHATGVGLIIEAAKAQEQGRPMLDVSRGERGIFERMVSWFKDGF